MDIGVKVMPAAGGAAACDKGARGTAARV